MPLPSSPIKLLLYPIARVAGAMIPGGSSSCFPSNPQGSSFNDVTSHAHLYQAMDDILFSPASPAAAAPAAASSCADVTSSHALLYDLAVLKEKVQQLESFASTIMISPNPAQLQKSMAMVQEIILMASSLGCTLQQADTPNAPELPPRNTTTVTEAINNQSSSNKAVECSSGSNFLVTGGFNFSCGHSGSELAVVSNGGTGREPRKAAGKSEETAQQGVIIELDAADLLARYTHYCQVCGKGFRRDANLRMHMRAHGDEFKSAAALSNPTKSGGSGGGEQTSEEGRKYSCPQEGCRWNRKHARFQPLKSMVCVKNHYRRSHCPKMYVCNRCGLKQFSVLSDLRTHEKHCGDQRWRCSCGTNFSRKDKLMGHVALFVGHTPETI